MGWPTDEELTSLAEAIIRAGDALPFPDWMTTVVKGSNAAAQGFVRATLGPLGYSLTQIEAWAGTLYGHSLILDIGLFFCSVKARLDIRPAEEQNSAPAVLDRRAELQAQLVLVDDNGVIVVPAGAGDGQSVVLHGRVNTKDETFRDRSGNWRKW